MGNFLAAVLRGIADKLDPNGNGGNFNVNTVGAGMNFSSTNSSGLKFAPDIKYYTRRGDDGFGTVQASDFAR